MEVGLVLIIVLVLGVFVLFAIAKNKEDEKEGADNKLVMGDDFIASSTAGPEGASLKSNIVETSKKGTINHVISTIYMCPEDTSVWVCPNCECKNQLNVAKCCVCRRSR